jgi:hypothetical protein
MANGLIIDDYVVYLSKMMISIATSVYQRVANQIPTKRG